MEGLALIAAVLFLSVLISGPIAYVAALIQFIPQLIVSTLAIFAIFVGFYWAFLPIGPMRFVGAWPIYCGFCALSKRIKKLEDNHTKSQDSQNS